MKKKNKRINKSLVFGLLTCVFFTGLPVYATEFNEILTNQLSTSLVKLNKESDFNIRIPKSIVLTDDGTKYSADYIISITGDIAGNESISVKPDEIVFLSSKNKTDVTAYVIQDKTNWTFNEFNILGNGNISSSDITAGDWSGYLNFNIDLERKSNIIVNATDSNGNILTVKAFSVIGNQKEKFLSSLAASRLMVNTSKIDFIIELTSDNFEDLANATFDVSNIAKPGDSIVIVNYDELNKIWGYINTEIVQEDSTISINFSDNIPVDFVKINESGNIETVYYVPFTLTSSNYTQAGIQSLEGDIVIPRAFEYNGVNYIVYSIGEENPYPSKEKGFYNCEEITSIIIPEFVRNIEDYAFYGCDNLSTVKMSDNVIFIGAQAFSNCINLKDINLSSEIKTVENSAFGETSWLAEQQKISENGLVIHNNVIIDAKNVQGDLIIPNGVTYFSDYLFKENDKLTSVYIPNSMTSLGYYAFYNCKNLTEVIFEENSKLTSLGNRTFEGCSNLSNIEIPNTVTLLNDCTFLSCTSLKNIRIPESVTIIGNYAFKGCSKLTDIEIPENVTNINYQAFYDCTNLSKVIYKGEEYFSKSSLINTLRTNRITVNDNSFNNTKLTE